MWKLKNIDVYAFEDEPLSATFRFRVKTLTVEDEKIVHGVAGKSRTYDNISSASADRLQKLLETDAFECRTYLYRDGIILTYRKSA